MKFKIRDYVLFGIALIALILLIPSFRAIISPAKYYYDPQYMSFIGGLISVLRSKPSTTYGELIKAIGVIQIIEMLATIAVAGVTFLFSKKEKKTGLFTVLSIILGLFALDWIWLDGGGFSFYAFLAILLFLASIASPIVGKVEKKA